MKFLIRSWTFLRRLWSTPKPSRKITAAEGVGPFLFSSKDYRRSDMTPKTPAFMPSKKYDNKSVYRVSGLDITELKKIGWIYVGIFRGKRPKAFAEVRAEKCQLDSLRLVPDIRPHPRHANIDGWPSFKPAQMSLAQQIATHARVLEL